jgi:hypothetical protein
MPPNHAQRGIEQMTYSTHIGPTARRVWAVFEKDGTWVQITGPCTFETAIRNCHKAQSDNPQREYCVNTSMVIYSREFTEQ